MNPVRPNHHQTVLFSIDIITKIMLLIGIVFGSHWLVENSVVVRENSRLSRMNNQLIEEHIKIATEFQNTLLRRASVTNENNKLLREVDRRVSEETKLLRELKKPR